MKTCPFCNGEVELTQEDNYGYYSYDDYDWLICCYNCGLLFGWAMQYTKDEVIKAWNEQ